MAHLFGTLARMNWRVEQQLRSMNELIDEDVHYWKGIQRVSLVPGTSNLAGHDGRRVLRTPSGNYVAVATASQPVLALLEGGASGGDLFALLAVGDEDRVAAEQGLARFLSGLRSSAVLSVPPAGQGSRRQRVIAQARREFFLKVVSTQRLARTLGGLGARLRSWPRWSIVVAITALPVAALIIAVALVDGSNLSLSVPIIGITILILAWHLCVHECFHAVAMGYNHLKVDDMGIGLALFVSPVAFVDRGETYTLNSRAARIAIALAGPACDATLAGCAALLGVYLPGYPGDAFALASVIQIYLLAANLNPLFRTDGYHALEALVGAVNMRSRATTYVLSRILRTPLPDYMTQVSPRVVAGYVFYLAGGGVYLIVFVALAIIGAQQIALS